MGKAIRTNAGEKNKQNISFSLENAGEKNKTMNAKTRQCDFFLDKWVRPPIGYIRNLLWSFNCLEEPIRKAFQLLCRRLRLTGKTRVGLPQPADFRLEGLPPILFAA